MNYTANKPPELDRDVHVDDLKDFFVNYLKNNNLGLIATAHLGWADLCGPKSEKCLRLASLHSKAVDYSKTGEPAEMLNSDHLRKWPHFMEKRLVYHSQKALGLVYDRVIKQKIEFSPDWQPSFDQRISKRFELDDAILDEALAIKEQYDIAVRRILSQHNLGTEFELYSGWAMMGPAVGSDYKRQEDLGCEYDALKQRLRDTCYEAAGGYDETKIDRFVAAMYRVTEEQINAALSESRDGCDSTGGAAIDIQGGRLEATSMPLMSFPWIFPEVMTRLALGERYNPRKSVLAAAHRVSVPIVQSKAAQGRHGISQGPIMGREIASGNGAKGSENNWSEEVANGLSEQDEDATQNQSDVVEIAGPVNNAMNRLSIFDDD
ncbi:putative RNA-dependent RNA polymerase 1 [Escovopsis weberi]|uniref:RNA-dependent RNA polymerase n=1 Tax=Escovopsis weberi TaxID=150374 RepID=A0A0M8MWD5_ESCWE|nr:putative RNA-dependent RNA polymerase 1 [Escovopsis weberi]